MNAKRQQKIAEGRLENLQGIAKVETTPLSRLPGELLDLVFKLAASNPTWTTKLTPRPISKSLLPSQDRALYETIELKSPRRFTELVCTLDAHPHKGRFTKKLVLEIRRYDETEPLDRQHLLRHFPNLLEIEFNHDNENVPQSLSDPALVPSLRICRLAWTRLNSAILDSLSRIPTLRLVEVSDIEFSRDEEDKKWTSATQVLQIAVTTLSALQSQSKLLRFFPAASISSIDIHVYNTRDTILPLLWTLGSELQSLRLRSDSDREDRPFIEFEKIDHLLPQYTNLRDLHLDDSFFSETLPIHLLDLPNLVSLSLGYYEQSPNLDELFDGLERVPHLGTLTLKYINISEGFEFDFNEAANEATYREDGHHHEYLPRLQGMTHLSQMPDWNLPWEHDPSEIEEAAEMEKAARAVGLIVESNLAELLHAFRRQVVEFYNMAVADLYLNGRIKPLKAALSLAKRHDLDINRIKINLDDDFTKRDLEWFTERVEGIGGFRGREDYCQVAGLRMKTASEYGNSDEEEEESDPWAYGWE